MEGNDSYGVSRGLIENASLHDALQVPVEDLAGPSQVDGVQLHLPEGPEDHQQAGVQLRLCHGPHPQSALIVGRPVTH